MGKLGLTDVPSTPTTSATRVDLGRGPHFLIKDTDVRSVLHTSATLAPLLYERFEVTHDGGLIVLKIRDLPGIGNITEYVLDNNLRMGRVLGIEYLISKVPHRYGP